MPKDPRRGGKTAEVAIDGGTVGNDQDAARRPRVTAFLSLGVILLVVFTAAVDFYNPNLNAFLASSTAEEHKILSANSNSSNETDRVLELAKTPRETSDLNTAGEVPASSRAPTTEISTSRVTTLEPTTRELTHQPTPRPTRQPTVKPTPIKSTPVLQRQPEKDHCGFHHPPETRQSRRNIHWLSYNTTSNDQKLYFQKVHTCAQRFQKLTHAQRLTRDFYSPSLQRTLETLVCDMQVTQQTVLSLVTQHDNILFAGDSVLRQQYFVFVCLVNPEVRQYDWSLWEPLSHDSHFVYHYRDARAPNGTTTTISFEPIGWRWNRHQKHLWTGAFPDAVKNFGPNDAIVMDSSRHYASHLATLYEEALNHTLSQARQAQATIYYMEPTPEEWPTSNGLYTEACVFVCTCRHVGKEQLDGQAIPIDPRVDFTRNDTKGKLPVPSFAFFEKLYGAKAHAFTTNVSKDDQSCFPDCVPATWRVDLVRFMLQTKNATPQQIQLVPIYWQLVGMNHPSAKGLVGDCTHRSMDAVVFMNEQLLRSMMLRRERMHMDHLMAMRSP